MFDIDKHRDDPMMQAFCKRRMEASASPLDRANAALLRADQAAAIFSGQADECDKAQIASACERVALAAAACGIATRNQESEVAEQFAKAAEGEAVTLDAYDNVRLEGLPRPVVFS